MTEIRITQDQLRLMSLFEGKTHVAARDCVEDERHDRVIFVVDEGRVAAAIGKGGSSIRAAQNAIKRNVEIVEYAPDPAKFVANVLNRKLVSDVRISRREDGSMAATVMVDPAKKALAIGREGRNASKARLLAQRHFGISSVSIESAPAAVQGGVA